MLIKCRFFHIFTLYCEVVISMDKSSWVIPVHTGTYSSGTVVLFVVLHEKLNPRDEMPFWNSWSFDMNEDKR